MEYIPSQNADETLLLQFVNVQNEWSEVSTFGACGRL